MSRIGNKPIKLPEGVQIELEGTNVTVKGKKGTLSWAFDELIKVQINDNEVLVQRSNDDKKSRALHGLTRALLFNMVTGVSIGFEKALKIKGVGYRAQKQGKKLVLTLGYSHPVEIEEEDEITIEVPTPNDVIVKGISKEKVGHVAALIRGTREPDPYKGKGVSYANEVIKLKEGKAGGKGKK